MALSSVLPPTTSTGSPSAYSPTSPSEGKPISISLSPSPAMPLSLPLPPASSPSPPTKDPSSSSTSSSSATPPLGELPPPPSSHPTHQHYHHQNHNQNQNQHQHQHQEKHQRDPPLSSLPSFSDIPVGPPVPNWEAPHPPPSPSPCPSSTPSTSALFGLASSAVATAVDSPGLFGLAPSISPAPLRPKPANGRSAQGANGRPAAEGANGRFEGGSIPFGNALFSSPSPSPSPSPSLSDPAPPPSLPTPCLTLSVPNITQEEGASSCPPPPRATPETGYESLAPKSKASVDDSVWDFQM